MAIVGVDDIVQNSQNGVEFDVWKKLHFSLLFGIKCKKTAYTGIRVRYLSIL